jgi:hypothetical protein
VKRFQFWAVALLLALTAIGAQAQLYKCAGPDGKTTYQGTPCNGVEKDKGKVTDFSKGEASPKPANASLNLAKHQAKIDFGDNKYSRLTKAQAVLESVEIDGRNCDWALKVTQDQSAVADKCLARFLSQMTEKAEFEQATQAITSLLTDQDFYKQNAVQFASLLETTKRIAGYSQFAKVRLGIGK